MKRIGLLGLALLFAVTRSAGAQGLTMQMSNGWNFSFSGNVNGFLIYHHGDNGDNGGCGGEGCVTSADQASRIRTGLLPAFAVFDAKGKEGSFDLGVHFGFAPQINSNSLHDNFGAQIDMRQVYLTVGGGWGQVLVGRELGLYQRQNILTDITLFGTGASGGVVGAGGTTLGRIGYGYTYPNFNAQITYSTAGNKPGQLSIGLFDPSEVIGGATVAGATFSGTQTPRLEGEFTYKAKRAMLWINGLFQHTKASAVSVDNNPSVDSYGAGGGVKLDFSRLSLVGSGYFQKGVGTTLMFGQLGGALAPSDNTAGVTGRDTYGYLAQATFNPTDSKWTLGASYGDSRVKKVDLDGDSPNLVDSNKAIDGIINYQWTKSLKWVLEGTWMKSSTFANTETHAFSAASGLMLFF